MYTTLCSASIYSDEQEGDDTDPLEVVELFCNGKLIDTRWDLATVKKYVWRKSDDLLLVYKRKSKPKKEVLVVSV